MAKIDASLRVFVVEFGEHYWKSFTYYQKNVRMFNVENYLVTETDTPGKSTLDESAFD
jgi:hypothetical protein